MRFVEDHILYRLFNKDHELLYVGITCNITGRISGHAHTKLWFREVTHATMLHYATRGELMRAEWLAIKTEEPRYNKAYNDVPQPSVMKKLYRARIVKSDANSFPPPDGIATDYEPLWKVQLEQQHGERQQLAALRAKLAEADG